MKRRRWLPFISEKYHELGLEQFLPEPIRILDRVYRQLRLKADPFYAHGFDALEQAWLLDDAVIAQSGPLGNPPDWLWTACMAKFDAMASGTIPDFLSMREREYLLDQKLKLVRSYMKKVEQYMPEDLPGGT
jgi:hypothetical protein